MKRTRPLSAAERLVAVATELFYRRGFRAVSVDEIVEQTGVTKPTLYRNFASKDELGAACLVRIANDDLNKLLAIDDAHPGDALRQLRMIVEISASRINDVGYRGWAFSNTEVEITDAFHPARRVCEAYKAKVREHLQTLARAGGLVRSGTLADGLLLLIEGAAASRHGFGPEGPSASLRACCDTLIAAHMAQR